MRRYGDNADNVILGASPAGYWGVFLTIDQNTEGARWEQYVTVPPAEKGPDGTQVAGWNYYGGASVINSVVITNKASDPTLAAKWIDGLYSLEATCRAYAELGSDWRWAEAGEMGINGKQGVWKQLVTWSSDAMRGHWWGQWSLLSLQRLPPQQKRSTRPNRPLSRRSTRKR